jgi:hypothetical protein
VLVSPTVQAPPLLEELEELLDEELELLLVELEELLLDDETVPLELEDEDELLELLDDVPPPRVIVPIEATRVTLSSRAPSSRLEILRV